METRLRGGVIERIDRRGKNILIILSGGLTMRVHLRMTGNLYVIPDWRLREARSNAWFALDDGRGRLFEDTRGLGTLTIHEGTGLERLGPEPLSRQFTAEAFVRSADGLRQTAKLFLLDQRRIAGMGNIYAAEALFVAGIIHERGAVVRPKLKPACGDCAYSARGREIDMQSIFASRRFSGS